MVMDMVIIINLGNRNFYLGSTKLRHNPIVHPVNDWEYNKYLIRYRNMTNRPLMNSGNTIMN